MVRFTLRAERLVVPSLAGRRPGLASGGRATGDVPSISISSGSSRPTRPLPVGAPSATPVAGALLLPGTRQGEGGGPQARPPAPRLTCKRCSEAPAAGLCSAPTATRWLPARPGRPHFKSAPHPSPGVMQRRSGGHVPNPPPAFLPPRWGERGIGPAAGKLGASELGLAQTRSLSASWGDAGGEPQGFLCLVAFRNGGPGTSFGMTPFLLSKEIRRSQSHKVSRALRKASLR